MSSEYNKVFDAQNILSIFYIFLLDTHQDIYLIQSQMHLLSSSSYYLYCHILTSFVVKCSYNLSKSTSSQTLKQFIPISYLLVLSPDVSSFKVIFPWASSDSNVINCLLIDEFNPLMFWQNLLILLNNLFTRKSR